MSTTATSGWPIRMCNYGHRACLIKKSGSQANPSWHYYKCPQKNACTLWIGWCDEYVPNMTQFNHGNLTSDATSDHQRYLPTINDDLQQICAQLVTLNEDCARMRAQHVDLINTMRAIITLFAVICAMASPNNIQQVPTIQQVRVSPRKKDSSALTQQVIPAPSNNTKAPRVNWDSFTTRTFLEVIAQVIEEEGQATTQLSKQQWTKIVGQMYALAQMILVPKQCQNRYNALKKDWQQNDIVGKFREGPLEHQELMQHVFQGVAATTRFARTPGMPSRNPVDSDMELSEGEGNTIGRDGSNEVEVNIPTS
ncbi:hypothetical protein Vadar_024361 [Vaccinium darrowii]|uniref:Uncharacterized protein n=1 Tax=Vaccinium darrowii TaxID=229202 RepID=A0ACB7Y2S6_9ERIC|nr:hypothetical protein Vadar_024361 [Vaccinium darrowii]